MEANVFKRNYPILIDINSTNATQRHIIYQPQNVPTDLNPIDVTFNGFIQDLRVKIDVTSFDEVLFPVLEPELTEAERLREYTMMEWSNSRCELSLQKSLNGVDWVEIGRISLQNRRPYYSLDILPFITKQADALVAGDWLSCTVLDVGYGSLAADDSVVIFGSGQLEAHYYASPSAALPQVATSATNFRFDVTTTSQLLLPANPNRKGFFASNTSTGRIFLGLGEPAVLFKGIQLNGRGSVYTIDYASMWQGDIYAITNATSAQVLSCVEFV